MVTSHVLSGNVINLTKAVIQNLHWIPINVKETTYTQTCSYNTVMQEEIHPPQWHLYTDSFAYVKSQLLLS